jgi:hypothetical protein
MNQLSIDIESLVLDGVSMSPTQGRRVAELTELALQRLLSQRASAWPIASVAHEERLLPDPKPVRMTTPSHASEARWAEELALILYRAIDRNV